MDEMKQVAPAAVAGPIDKTGNPPPCNQDVFDNGMSVGLFDIPKWTAEAICTGIANATRAPVDWHYVGGRVHIKAMPAPAAQGDALAAAPTTRPAPPDGDGINTVDVQRLVRELDVALNGEDGAAPQASLCDVVSQVKHEASKLGRPVLAAPAAGAGPSEAVAYLDIGTGGYLDLGTDLTDEALSRLSKGRHALVIAGTYGIDGYTAAPNTQPAPVALGLSDQDAGLLEQGASMLEALANDERNSGNDSAAMGAECSAHAVRRLAAVWLAAAREGGAA